MAVTAFLILVVTLHTAEGARRKHKPDAVDFRAAVQLELHDPNATIETNRVERDGFAGPSRPKTVRATIQAVCCSFTFDHKEKRTYLAAHPITVRNW